MEFQDVPKTLTEVTNLSDEVAELLLNLENYDDAEEILEKAERLARLSGDALAGIFWLLRTEPRLPEQS